ncbi:MAG: hypothetical protein ACM3U0_00305 [archaeon]
MNNCKILLIDSPPEIILMEEVLGCLSLPIDLRCCSSLSEAIQEIEVETPDMIMIGSGMLLWKGLEAFKNRIIIPTVILCEGKGFEIMVKEDIGNVLYLTRPFDLDEVPETFTRTLEFLKDTRGGDRCTPRK